MPVVMEAPKPEPVPPALAPSQFETTSHHRGMQNLTGQNHCFLNVLIQLLWHVGAFRVALFENMKSDPTSSSSRDDSLLEALKTLFINYKVQTQFIIVVFFVDSF